MRVALVSSWQFSPAFHILQVTGERHDAMTGDDGGFTISGARPGVQYTLIWQGQFGDITDVDASGTPLYTVTVQSLQGADMGTIAIGMGAGIGGLSP